MTAPESIVEFLKVSFSHGDKLILHNANFSLAAGKITSIVGPSGCGKSTVLRLIAGLLKPLSGHITCRTDNTEFPHSNNSARFNNSGNQLRFLFQNYDAYPWYTVWENIKLGSGPSAHPDNQEIENLLAEVGLLAERNRYPEELSGGMRKRLGLARCLIAKPAILLLDEPFSSLDIDTRYDMYALLQQLWQETGCAIVIVTHDIHEAILLSDKIIVLSHPPVSEPAMIDINLQHPRTDDITQTNTYLSIRQSIVESLKLAGINSRSN